MKLFGFKRHKKAKKKTEWSKMLSSLVIIFGFIIAQEAMALMLLCIMYGFTATAAYITAAVGLAEAVIAAGLSAYLGLCKVDHKGPDGEGITFAAAKAKNFEEGSDDRGPTI